MAQMSTALFAADLIAHHAVTGVAPYEHVFGMFRLPETGPARSRVELCRRVEQHAVATYAAIHTILVAIPVDSGKCGFRSALACHPVLLLGQLFAPFGIGFFGWLTQGL